jgi:hypothetical protein
VPPDAVAGDGIYTAGVQLTSTSLLEYKLLPHGVWDGSEIQAVGTCPADGGPTANSTQNIQVVNPDVSSTTLFFYDSRMNLDPSYSAAPSNGSGGDSVMLTAPAGTTTVWLAVGDFQDTYGPNASAVKLSSQGQGVLSGSVTATKALAAGWQWQVMEQTTGVVREYGPTGWAYAPCQAAFASVSSAVAIGDQLTFVLHSYGGRMQTMVAGAGGDGFMAGDLSQPSSPSATDLGPDAFDLGPFHGRPGIHCDCQVGSASGRTEAPLSPLAWLAGLGLLGFRLRGRATRKRFTVERARC